MSDPTARGAIGKHPLSFSCWRRYEELLLILCPLGFQVFCRIPRYPSVATSSAESTW